jgi:predicted AlkP superfamily phosphohydrolase/phosphomutase
MGGAARRLIVVGIDGGMFTLVERFLEAGVMPHLKRLTARGTLTESLPSIPVDTPTNWTTIMTGAEPSTHGIHSFTSHTAGEPMITGERDRYRNKHSTFSKAEFLWNTLEEAGRRVAVVNYPTGWPSTLRQGVVIGGLTPGADLWRIAKPVLYATGRPTVVVTDLPAIKVAWRPLPLREVSGWPQAPSRGRAASEAEIEIGGDGQTRRLALLFVDSEGRGVDRLVVAPERNAKTPLAVLGAGEWSPWLRQRFGDHTGIFRLKLAHLSRDGREVELYVTDVFHARGWAFPEGLEDSLIEHVGPYVEGFECPYIPVDLNVRPYGPANLSTSMLLEHARIQAQWMSGAARYLQQVMGWDALILHYHYIDTLNHTYLGYLHDRFPFTSAQRTAQTWELYLESYRILDDLIGGLTALADDHTLVVVTSDHAALPCWRYVAVTRVLQQAGLMTFEWDPALGKYIVDLSRSKVVPYLDPQHIWVNLQGREPEGVVPADRYERTRDEVIAALLTLRDPETGDCPVQIAARREDLGVSGKADERIGDVLFFLRPGYTTWDGTLESLRFQQISPERMTAPLVAPSEEVVGHHTPYLPNARLDLFANSAFTVLAGPGVRAGYRRPRPIRLIDLAPTIASLMALRAPRDSQGTIPPDLSSGW